MFKPVLLMKKYYEILGLPDQSDKALVKEHTEDWL